MLRYWTVPLTRCVNVGARLSVWTRVHERECQWVCVCLCARIYGERMCPSLCVCACACVNACVSVRLPVRLCCVHAYA